MMLSVDNHHSFTLCTAEKNMKIETTGIVTEIGRFKGYNIFLSNISRTERLRILKFKRVFFFLCVSNYQFYLKTKNK